jgi:diadenosine tetraphosphate (Ap4A) HIT family hydrolase
MDRIIFETENFVVKAVGKPHIGRSDGEHIIISPKARVTDRTEFSPALAIEYARLTLIAGEAMTTVLNMHGVDLGRINYQDNGNWGVYDSQGPSFHLHLYGRAKSAKIQKWGEACNFPQPSTGYYDGLEPLSENDVEEMNREMMKIFSREKYKDDNWRL